MTFKLLSSAVIILSVLSWTTNLHFLLFFFFFKSYCLCPLALISFVTTEVLCEMNTNAALPSALPRIVHYHALALIKPLFPHSIMCKETDKTYGDQFHARHHYEVERVACLFLRRTRSVLVVDKNVMVAFWRASSL